jgi:hypothetical protein
MKCRLFMGLLAVTAMVAVNQDAYGQELRQSVANGTDAKGRAQVSPIGAGERGTPASFTGEKTSWHGFDRFDFLMDDAALTVQPIKASPDEKNGIDGQAKGQLRCVVVVPKEAAPGKPAAVPKEHSGESRQLCRDLVGGRGPARTITPSP